MRFMILLREAGQVRRHSKCKREHHKKKQKTACVLGVVCHKLKVEHARRRDAFVDDSAGTAVVVKISRLLEQANGRALAGVDDSDAGLRDSGGVDFPHSVKFGDVFVSFLQHELGAVETRTIDNDGLGKIAIVGICVRIHGAIKKSVDIGSVLLALDVIKTAGEKLAGIMRVRSHASKWTGSVNRYLKKRMNTHVVARACNY